MYGLNNPLTYIDPTGHEPCINGVNPENGNICTVVTGKHPDRPEWYDFPGWFFVGFSNLITDHPKEGATQLAYAYAGNAAMGFGISKVLGYTGKIKTNVIPRVVWISKAARLAEVFRRLNLLPKAANAEEAMLQMNTTLEAVEDQALVPREANPGMQSTERMYPAQEDNIVRGSDGSITAKSRGHITRYGADGSVTVTERATGKVVFQK